MTKAARTLVRWGLVSEHGRGPYLAGREDHGGSRTSTPLVELDLQAGTALTASGRPYRLTGEADPAFGLAVAVDVWGTYFDLAGADLRALSEDEAVALMAENGNAPFIETIEERAAIAKRYGIRLDEEGDVLGPNWLIPDPAEGEDGAWGSGNVFHDLGLPDPDVLLVRADLASSIAAAVADLGLTMREGAEATGLTEEQVAGIVGSGRTEGLSIERLDKALEALVASPDQEQERKP